jgi:acyl carrier protein
MDRTEIEKRLVTTFEAVFPDMSPEQIRAAEQPNVEAWDSIAAINLITVVEEQFEVELDFEELSRQTSFQALADYLAGVVG